VKPLTLQQLIDKLQQIPDKTVEVTIDGCDCSGQASAVHVDPDGLVIIRRDDYPYRADEQDWVVE
jgi:hypothetical protein